MEIKLNDVQSNNLKAVGYDAGTKTLRVQFKGGRIYDYAGVPQDQFDELQKAKSKGSFFHSNIRTNTAYKSTLFDGGDKKPDAKK